MFFGYEHHTSVVQTPVPPFQETLDIEKNKRNNRGSRSGSSCETLRKKIHPLISATVEKNNLTEALNPSNKNGETNDDSDFRYAPKTSKNTLFHSQ